MGLLGYALAGAVGGAAQGAGEAYDIGMKSQAAMDLEKARQDREDHRAELRQQFELDNSKSGVLNGTTGYEYTKKEFNSLSPEQQEDLTTHDEMAANIERDNDTPFVDSAGTPITAEEAKDKIANGEKVTSMSALEVDKMKKDIELQDAKTKHYNSQNNSQNDSSSGQGGMTAYEREKDKDNKEKIAEKENKDWNDTINKIQMRQKEQQAIVDSDKTTPESKSSAAESYNRLSEQILSISDEHPVNKYVHTVSVSKPAQDSATNLFSKDTPAVPAKLKHTLELTEWNDPTDREGGGESTDAGNGGVVMQPAPLDSSGKPNPGALLQKKDIEDGPSWLKSWAIGDKDKTVIPIKANKGTTAPASVSAPTQPDKSPPPPPQEPSVGNKIIRGDIEPTVPPIPRTGPDVVNPYATDKPTINLQGLLPSSMRSNDRQTEINSLHDSGKISDKQFGEISMALRYNSAIRKMSLNDILSLYNIQN